MNQQNDINKEQIDYDTFVKDAQKLNLDPLMDEEKRIFGLYSI